MRIRFLVEKSIFSRSRVVLLSHCASFCSNSLRADFLRFDIFYFFPPAAIIFTALNLHIGFNSNTLDLLTVNYPVNYSFYHANHSLLRRSLLDRPVLALVIPVLTNPHALSFHVSVSF